MDINLFFEKMVKELNLGTIVEEPLKVTGNTIFMGNNEYLLI